MANKLTETQRAMLAEAAQRGDHCFTLPEGRRLAAARRATDSLLAAGLAREVRARGEAPVWRRDKESQSAFALKLTAAGIKAIAVIADNGEDGSQPTPPRETVTDLATATRTSPPAPRSGTKIDNVVKMLRRPEGEPAP